MRNRLLIATLTGAILGILCIIGIGLRLGFADNGLFLFSAWYNRVVMGLLIGLAGSLQLLKNDRVNSLVRGAILGLIVSLSWYVASDGLDLMGFLAGIVYGVIIDFVATKYSK